ncbi:MAG: transposase [Candidatus Thiodiazotropha sp. (ex Lucinoma borealis)]|nr:transposase [Candidatus Thiodiazotropha sp. (ex Lucinoma borealis)]
MKKRETHTFYNFQFKHTAVRITEHPNIQSIDVAEAFRIHPVMLYRWHQEMREGKLENNDQEARSRDKLLEAKKKIKKLERELRQVREENSILKKAERLLPGKK